MNVALRIERELIRKRELRRILTVDRPRADQLSRRRELLDPLHAIACPTRDVDVAGAVDSDGARIREWSVGVLGRRPGSERRTLRREFYNAVVVAVGDVDVALF